jgi:hypothetical protein
MITSATIMSEKLPHDKGEQEEIETQSPRRVQSYGIWLATCFHTYWTLKKEMICSSET